MLKFGKKVRCQKVNHHETAIWTPSFRVLMVIQMFIVLWCRFTFHGFGQALFIHRVYTFIWHCLFSSHQMLSTYKGPLKYNNNHISHLYCSNCMYWQFKGSSGCIMYSRPTKDLHAIWCPKHGVPPNVISCNEISGILKIILYNFLFSDPPHNITYQLQTSPLTHYFTWLCPGIVQFSRNPTQVHQIFHKSI